MIGKKCPSCAKKIKKDFNYCPYCGAQFKTIKDKENFGMLGREDNGFIQNEVRLPFGMNKIVNSLIKQLEKQMSDLEMGGGDLPKGFKIKISGGQPQMNQIIRENHSKITQMPEISEEENERRAKLPKVEVESKVRRFSDKIVYELDTPGVGRQEDVVLTELATGIEIKAYSKNKCYVKSIPLKVQVLDYSVRGEKVFVELKG